MASGFTRGRDHRNRVHMPVQPCRSCKQPMLWVTMPSGRRNPLDLEPSAEGNIIVVEREHNDEHWRVGVVLQDRDMLQEARELEIPTYVSHFATCPEADEQRKPRERADLA